MSLLLEDLAEESSASNARAADRLDAEARALSELGRAETEREGRAAESARQATEYAITQAPEVEGFWREALAVLRKQPTGEYAGRYLRPLLQVLESGRRLVQSARALWVIAEEAGGGAERLDELGRAEGRLEKLATEATRALEHRTRDWQPADPTRLARGLQMAREGVTLKADEALARFRRPRG